MNLMIILSIIPLNQNEIVFLDAIIGVLITSLILYYIMKLIEKRERS